MSLARCLLALLAPSGCLVAEPPSYQNPNRIPPLVNLSGSDPNVARITTINAATYPFSVPFRSEDQGERVLGILYRNYNVSDDSQVGPPIGYAQAPPSTFDDTSRTMRVVGGFPANLRGCHQITMLLTHSDNIDFGSDDDAGAGLPRPISPDDVAIATWWVNVRPSETDPDFLGVCPNPED